MATKKGIIRFFLITVLAAGTVSAAVYGMTAGKEAFKQSSYFKVKSVSVKGLIKADGKKVESMIKGLVGRSIFDVTTDSVNYQGDAWVERMEIRKVFPDRLDVVVFEKRPIFKLKQARGCFTATSTGLLIKDNCANTRVNMEKSVSQKDFKEFLKIYQENAYLKDRSITLKEFYFTMNDNGVTLMAPYSTEDFNRLYGAYEKVVKKRYKTIEYVDMRVPEKIFVKGVM